MAAFRRRNGSEERSRAPSTSSAVAKFAVGGLAALAAVGIGSYFLVRHIGTTEAIDNAKTVTRILGRQIVEPRLTDGIVHERPSSIRRLDRVVENNVLQGQVLRVKIWTASGRIVYSDKHRLIGSRYQLGADDLAVLRSGGVDAGVTDLSQPENRFERSKGDVMEVYLPVHTPSGRRLLFEVYQRFSSIASSGSSIWKAFAPALIGALLILALLQVPLAVSMARRLRRGHAEREALLERSIEASDRERRRIAGDLHDGVVQSLVGTSFSLAAAAERVNGGTNGSARQVLERGAAQTRQSVRELRSLLVEIYPPSLRNAGLQSALTDLLERVDDRGIATRLDMAAGLWLPADTEAVFFRVAQEAVRNAVAHAEPTVISVAVSAGGGRASLTVTDDGRGFPEGDAAAPGHFGLQLMRDLAQDADGELTVDSGPGRGARIGLEVPLR
ncbi:MAG: sensor histidine kinase [Solirubrobacterales bacterium]